MVPVNIRMMKHFSFASFFLFQFSFTLLLQAQSDVAPPAEESVSAPHLELVVDVDFGKDPRLDFETNGDVSWSPDMLTLPANSSITFDINGGEWASAEMEWHHSSETSPDEPSEFRLWLLLDGATPCCVSLRRRVESGGSQKSTVAVIDSVEEDGQLTERVVREAPLPDGIIHRLTLQYRHGLVEVHSGDANVLRAYVANGSSTVVGLRPGSVTGSHVLASVRLRRTKPAGALTTEQEQRLAQAAQDEKEMLTAYQQGNFREAMNIGEKVFSTRRAVLGVHDRYVVSSLNNLALLQHRSGNLNGAEPLYRRALAIKKAVLGQHHPQYAAGLNNLAALYENLGQYDRAEQLMREALEILLMAFEEHHPDLMTTRSNLAYLYESTGDYSRAEPLYRQILTTSRTDQDGKNVVYATTLNNLATLYRRTGQFTSAEPLMQEAEEVTGDVFGKQHPQYARSLNNFADLYCEMGDYRRAEPLYIEAAEIRKVALGDDHPQYVVTLNNLALLYNRLNDPDQSEALYQQVLATTKKSLGEQHPEYAASLSNLAALYIKHGAFEKARPLLEQAEVVQRAVLGTMHPGYATSLNNLAILHEALGELPRAEALYQQVLTIRKTALGANHSDYAATLSNLAMLYEGREEFARAAPLFRQALQTERRNLDNNSVVQSARQQHRNQTLHRLYLDRRITNSLTGVSSPRETLEDMWRWKGAVTTRQQAYRQVTSHPNLGQLFQELQVASRQLSALSGQAPVPPSNLASDSERASYEQERSAWEKKFTAINRRQEDIEQRIAADSAEFRSLRVPLTVQAVQHWLPEDSVLIDFLEYKHHLPDPETPGQFNTERRFVAFVVRRDREPTIVSLGAATEIEKAIANMRRPLLTTDDTTESDAEAGRAADTLRRNLWLPVEAHFAGAETVIISQDGLLGTLAFVALPGRTPSSFLLEEYRITMIPMATQLRSLFDAHSSEASQRNLLLLGDVDYDAEVDSHRPSTSTSQLVAHSGAATAAGRLRTGNHHQWESLPGFRDELDAVTAAFTAAHPDESVTVLSGDAADERTFLSHARRYRTLHLITHGYFEDPGVTSIEQAGVRQSGIRTQQSNTDPFINSFVPGLLSGLAMAGANRQRSDVDDLHDGILRASEIEASTLQGVDLVVLSACETGLGAVAGGEGLTGLQRAFHIAGARSVIASLWKVDDRATQELMRRFYTNLWLKKMSKADALREAQLWMLQHPDELEAMGVRGTSARGLLSKSTRVDATDGTAASHRRTDPYFWAAFQLSGDWR